MPVLLDFESRSPADLRLIGGRNYWEHPSTEVLCCCWYDTETQDVGVWVPGDPPPVFTATLGAHNAMGFDRFAAARLGWPAVEIDTSELARRAGLPGALDALATRWLGTAKDKDASRFVLSLSRPSRAAARRGQLPPLTNEVMTRVVNYCLSDVEILAQGWPLLESWQALEPDVQWVDRRINDRGILFDVELAKRLVECDNRLQEQALEAAAKALDMPLSEVEAIASSPSQFCEFTGASDAQKETVDDLLEHGVGEVLEMARARRAIASIAGGKLEAGLVRVSPDGRLRDSLRYFGAHTGRWSGRGMQLQNLPRPGKRFETWQDGDICHLSDKVLAGKWADADEINLLLRATFCAKPGHTLIISD
jgi:DNA polymerase